MFEALISQVFGAAAQTVNTADPLLNALIAWGGRVQAAANVRWRANVIRQVPCGVPVRRGQVFAPCGFIAIDACGVCRGPTCLDHAMVAHNGDVACVKCMSEYQTIMRSNKKAAGMPDPAHKGPVIDNFEKKRRDALRALGLPKSASWEEVEVAYKKRLVKFHPDRAPEHKKDEHQKKFVATRVAYDWLVANRERKVA